jgi:hypothetical protein
MKFIYGEELLAARPTPKQEDHTLSAARDCLFTVSAATLRNWRPFLHHIRFYDTKYSAPFMSSTVLLIYTMFYWPNNTLFVPKYTQERHLT